MKKLFICFTLSILSLNIYAQVGVGTVTPHASAAFEVESTIKGFLPPRMTKRQMESIITPAEGLIVYCIDCPTKGLYINNGTDYVILAFGEPKVVPNAIGSLDCETPTILGAIYDGIAASVISSTISYTGGNGSAHTGQTVGSTGVTGLVATLSSGSFAIGNGTLVYTITGTASGTGTASFAIDIGGQTCTLTRTVVAVPIGDATFTNATNFHHVYSYAPLDDPETSPNVEQGTLMIGTTINVAYTGGSGSYAAISSPMVAISSYFCEDGASDWTFGYRYSGGNFSNTGNLVLTLITQKAGIDMAWTASQVDDLTYINDVVSALVVNTTTKTNTIGLSSGGDYIMKSLIAPSSKSSYFYASINQPVEITLAEYNNLLTIVPSSVSNGWIGGLSSGSNYSAGAGVAYPNSGNYLVPVESSYIVGVARAQQVSTTANSFNIMVSVGQSQAVCITDFGPNVLYNTTGWKYFAIKRPTTSTGTGYTAIGQNMNNGGLNATPAGYDLTASGWSNIGPCGTSYTNVH